MALYPKILWYGALPNKKILLHSHSTITTSETTDRDLKISNTNLLFILLLLFPKCLLELFFFIVLFCYSN